MGRDLLTVAEACYMNVSIPLIKASEETVISDKIRVYLFGIVLSQLTTLVKKLLQKHNFFALSVYNALLQQQYPWEEVLSRRGSEYLDDKNELRDGYRHCGRFAFVASQSSLLTSSLQLITVIWIQVSK